MLELASSIVAESLKIWRLRFYFWGAKTVNGTITTGENLGDSFKVHRAKVWNMLPFHISSSNKLASFKVVA